MRKSKREITDINQIEDLIKNLDTIRLGINDDKYPYVVPVSFGYEFTDGKFTFYIHGAKEGKKVELLAKNPNVCVEGDICYRFKDTISSVTCLYESLIAFGKASLVTGEEAEKGIKLVLKHCDYAEHVVNENVFSVMNVYKIEIEAITGKRRDNTN